MDVADIAGYLHELDGKPSKPWLRALTLSPHIPGGSKPWDCQATDGSRYIAKCRNNPQDERLGHPLKFLTTDLVCGRLGQLFDPPLCPPVEVIDVPLDVASVSMHPSTRRSPAYRPAPGPSFGSRRVDHAFEVKMSGESPFGGENPPGGQSPLDGIALEQFARLITFHTWLRGVDVSALITKDRRLLSIDHGYFLTVYRWDDPRFAKEERMTPKISSRFESFVGCMDHSMFSRVLEELVSLKDVDIVASFADIPEIWGNSLDLRTKAAAYVLGRRDSVPEAISRRWRK